MAQHTRSGAEGAQSKRQAARDTCDSGLVNHLLKHLACTRATPFVVSRGTLSAVWDRVV